MRPGRPICSAPSAAPWKAPALAGESPHSDIVVIRFPSVAALNDWFSSPAYQALIPLREQAADVLLLSYET